MTFSSSSFVTRPSCIRYFLRPSFGRLRSTFKRATSSNMQWVAKLIPGAQTLIFFLATHEPENRSLRAL
jgi:hypothetical protein